MKNNKIHKLSEKTVEKVATTIEEKSASKRVISARNITIRTYFTVVVIAFVVLAFFAHRVQYFPIDLTITRSIQLFHPFWFDFLMKATSFIGYFPQAIILVLVTVLFLYAVRLRFEAMVALGNGIIITLINLILKDIVNRPRPTIDLVRVFSHVGESSFPSGHVMFYFAFFGYLWFLTFTMLKNSALRISLLIVLTGVILLIAPSRIYLGAHWASDVFGAYLFSSIWLLVVIHVHNWGKSRFFVKNSLLSKKGAK